jgi:hypothetical protein
LDLIRCRDDPLDRWDTEVFDMCGATGEMVRDRVSRYVYATSRYEAVRAVIADGETVTDVAARFGVARKTVHAWLARRGSC